MGKIQRKTQKERRRVNAEINAAVKYIMSENEPKEDIECPPPPPPPVSRSVERPKKERRQRIRFGGCCNSGCCDHDGDGGQGEEEYTQNESSDEPPALVEAESEHQVQRRHAAELVEGVRLEMIQSGMLAEEGRKGLRHDVR